MIEGKSILALIPARGGSKGIKHKNIIDLCGKPLIAYTVEAAKKSRYIDDVILSTDDDEIAKVASEYGAEVPFMRPKELATDAAKTIDAVISAIDMLKECGRNYDILVLLQPTQPLRTEQDIDESLELFLRKGCKSVVAVSPVDDSPLLMRYMDEENKMCKVLDVSSTCRRQDMPNYYKVNGCIYINSIEEVITELSFNDNEIPYFMPRERAADIDEMVDLVVAEYYLKKSNM